MGAQLDVMEEGYIDHELFYLSNIKVYFHFPCQSIVFFFGIGNAVSSCEMHFPFYVNQGKNDLRAVDSTDYDDDNDELGGHENDVTNGENHGSSASDIDSDEERRRFPSSFCTFRVKYRLSSFCYFCDAYWYDFFRYDEHMEELLDQAYESFVSRKEGTAKQRKRIRKAYSDDAELLEV